MRRQDKENIAIFYLATAILFAIFILVLILNIYSDIPKGPELDKGILMLSICLFGWAIYLIYCFSEMLEDISKYYLNIIKMREEELREAYDREKV